MKLKSYRLTISASVVDLEDGKEVVAKEIAFDGRAPAVHHAIANFVYGIGVSLSTLHAAELEGDSEKKPKSA
jgi:hypothetical protein